MLSVLIPVYDFDVRSLVGELHRQCSGQGIPFEILLFDDASPPGPADGNGETSRLPGVVFRKLPQNRGRSRIRNDLAASARYPWLLFLDCDSGLVNSQFIAEYIRHLEPDKVLYGGRIYSREAPRDPEHLLHWKYGTEREALPARVRQLHPRLGFMTNNFVIGADVFQRIRFDDSILHYGHEDTLFGLELKKHGIPVEHLDNPLEHLGLETASVFLEKSRKAIDNLADLYLKRPGFRETDLLKTYLRMRSFGWIPLLRMVLRRAEPFLERQLRSATPRLLFFDLWRLYQLIKRLSAA